MCVGGMLSIDRLLQPLGNTPAVLLKPQSSVLTPTGAHPSLLCGPGWPVASLVGTASRLVFLTAVILEDLGFKTKTLSLFVTAVPEWQPQPFLYVILRQRLRKLPG